MSARSVKAQSVIEYALLISVVAIAFYAMYVYSQRALQANYNLIETRINERP